MTYIPLPRSTKADEAAEFNRRRLQKEWEEEMDSWMGK